MKLDRARFSDICDSTANFEQRRSLRYFDQIDPLKCSIGKLSTILQKQARLKPINTAGYSELGRCLMYLQSYRDASTAFEQEICDFSKGTAQGALVHEARCHGCGKFPNRGLHYVCLECPCIDLCGSCRDRSGGFHRNSKGHFAHKLLTIPSEAWFGRKTDKVNSLGETRL